MSDAIAPKTEGFGALIEVDYAVLHGHALLNTVCAKQLEASGVKLDQLARAHYMDGKSMSSGLSALAASQGKTIDAAALGAACNAAMAEALAATLKKGLAAGFVDFVKGLVAKDVKVVLISRVDTATLRSALPEALADKVCFHQDTSSSFGFLGWESWRRIIRKNGLHERECIAIAGSGYSVKGALTSGLYVFGCPTPETDYQDFSGADEEITEFSTALATKAAALIHRR